MSRTLHYPISLLMPLQGPTDFPVDVYAETGDDNDRKRWTRFRRDPPAPPDQFLLRSLNTLLFAYHTINADHIHGLLYGTRGRYRRGYRVNPNSTKSRRLRKISRGIADIAGILRDCCWARMRVVSPVVGEEGKPGASTEAPCRVATWLDMAAPTAVLPPGSPPALLTPLGVVAAASPSLRGFPPAAGTVAAWPLDDPSMASFEDPSVTSLGDLSKKTLPSLANETSLGLPITLLDDVSKTSFDVSETSRDRSMKASLDNLAMASPYLSMASTDVSKTTSLGRLTTPLRISMTSLDGLSMASFSVSMTWLDDVSSTPLALLSKRTSYGVSNTSPDDEISVTSLEISKQPSLDWTSDDVTTAAPDSAVWFSLSKSFAGTGLCLAGSIVSKASWNCVVRYYVGGSSVACPAEGADGTWILAKAVVLVFSSAGQDKASLMPCFESLCGVGLSVAQLSAVVPTQYDVSLRTVRRSDAVCTVALHFARL